MKNRIQNISQLKKQLHEMEIAMYQRSQAFLDFTHEGYHFSVEKTQKFIEELTSTVKDKNEKEFYKTFFLFSILFLEIQCNKNEFTFESILKVANVIEKHPERKKDVTDILIEDINQALDKNKQEIFKNEITLINNTYMRLNELYKDNYKVPFVEIISDLIDDFIFRNDLSLYSNDAAFEYISKNISMVVQRINRYKVGG